MESDLGHSNLNEKKGVQVVISCSLYPLLDNLSWKKWTGSWEKAIECIFQNKGQLCFQTRSFEFRVPQGEEFHLSSSHVAARSSRNILPTGRSHSTWSTLKPQVQCLPEVPSASCFCESAVLKAGCSYVLWTWVHDGANGRGLSRLKGKSFTFLWSPQLYWVVFSQNLLTHQRAQAVKIPYALSLWPQ